MMPDLWSWGLALVSITGMILIGMHYKIGWPILLALQGGWVAYGFHKGEEGFFLMAGASSVIYVFNWFMWCRKEKRRNVAGKAGGGEPCGPSCCACVRILGDRAED
jgi:hypothetical protein